MAVDVGAMDLTFHESEVGLVDIDAVIPGGKHDKN